MRVSTNEFYRISTQTILDQQSGLNRIQQQLATGRKLLSPADDPVGAALTLSLDSKRDRLVQQDRNGSQAISRLENTDALVKSVGDSLQRARELTVQAANASQTDATRKLIAEELEQIYAGLLSLANTRDANGEYIFAGTATTTLPFEQVGIGAARQVNYLGNDQQRFVAIGEDRQIPVNEPGSAIFFIQPALSESFRALIGSDNTGTVSVAELQVTAPPDAQTSTLTVRFSQPDGTFSVFDADGELVAGPELYDPDQPITLVPGVTLTLAGLPDDGDELVVEPTPSTSVFAVLDRLINAVTTPIGVQGEQAFRAAIDDTLGSLVDGIDDVLGVRARLGGRLKAADTQAALNGEQALQVAALRSAVADLDLVEAISEFQRRTIALQAAQQSFISVQGLTLFNFLR